MSQLKRRVKKQAKRRAKEHKYALKEQSERSAVQHFLQSIHVWEDLKRTHLNLDYLFEASPRIIARRASGTPQTARIEAMIRDIQKAVDDATLVLPGGQCLSVNMLWTRLLPALSTLYHSKPGDAEFTDVRHRVRHAVAPFITPEIIGSLFETIDNAVSKVVIAASRIDGLIYYLELKQETLSNGRMPVYVLLHQEKARVTSVVVDGNPRNAYWVGLQPWFGKGVSWIKWTSATLKVQHEEREYSVLVQPHALRRLLDRFGRSFSWGAIEALLHLSLWASLNVPVVRSYRQDDNSFLVEFRFLGIRVGYLLAAVVDKYVLIRTFLFLTMDGTPEGTELWRRLRLTRSDKEYLGLDAIETFAATDLRRDAYLVSLLEECNCAHLFDFFESDCPLKTGYAEAMKKHLGLTVRHSALCVGNRRHTLQQLV
jgi:hypothetical protein